MLKNNTLVEGLTQIFLRKRHCRLDLRMGRNQGVFSVSGNVVNANEKGGIDNLPLP